MQVQKTNILKDIKYFIIAWNNKFMYDRFYRQKYNIAFNSPQHRALSPIDMFIDIMEERLIEKHFKDSERQKQLMKEYKENGEFLIDLDVSLTDEEKDDMFDKIMQGIKKSS